jgi:hypothetical protein
MQGLGQTSIFFFGEYGTKKKPKTLWKMAKFLAPLSFVQGIIQTVAKQ